jgi:hypothetical protein
MVPEARAVGVQRLSEPARPHFEPGERHDFSRRHDDGRPFRADDGAPVFATALFGSGMASATQAAGGCGTNFRQIATAK